VYGIKKHIFLFGKIFPKIVPFKRDCEKTW